MNDKTILLSSADRLSRALPLLGFDAAIISERQVTGCPGSVLDLPQRRLLIIDADRTGIPVRTLGAIADAETRDLLVLRSGFALAGRSSLWVDVALKTPAEPLVLTNLSLCRQADGALYAVPVIDGRTVRIEATGLAVSWRFPDAATVVEEGCRRAAFEFASLSREAF